MADLKVLLGEKIKKGRIHKGLSLEQLGKSIGMTKSALSKVERGAVSITFENLYMISKELGISLNELTSDVESQDSQNVHNEAVPFFAQNWLLNNQNEDKREVLEEIEDGVERLEKNKNDLTRKIAGAIKDWLLDETSASNPGALLEAMGTAAQSVLSLFGGGAAAPVPGEKSATTENEGPEKSNTCITLAPDEEELLELYRASDERQKGELLGMLKMAVAMNRANESGDQGMTKQTSSSSILKKDNGGRNRKVM